MKEGSSTGNPLTWVRQGEVYLYLSLRVSFTYHLVGLSRDPPPTFCKFSFLLFFTALLKYVINLEVVIELEVYIKTLVVRSTCFCVCVYPEPTISND